MTAAECCSKHPLSPNLQRGGGTRRAAMKLQMFSDAAYRKATGRTWPQWRRVLRAMGAADLPHAEIAQRLVREHGVPGWWAQSITVAFERAIGRRQIGEVAGGFAASASRTLAGSKDKALLAWQTLVGRRRAFNGVAFAKPPVVRRTPKWRYWRATLADGSRVVVGIGAKAGGKAVLGLSHEKLPDARAARRWKIFWQSFLQELDIQHHHESSA
jgi:hypothetical protein